MLCFFFFFPKIENQLRGDQIHTCIPILTSWTDGCVTEWPLYSQHDATHNLLPEDSSQQIQLDNGVDFSVYETVNLKQMLDNLNEDRNCYNSEPEELMVRDG